MTTDVNRFHGFVLIVYDVQQDDRHSTPHTPKFHSPTTRSFTFYTQNLARPSVFSEVAEGLAVIKLHVAIQIVCSVFLGEHIRLGRPKLSSRQIGEGKFTHKHTSQHGKICQGDV